jgi:hypothetical protein
MRKLQELNADDNPLANPVPQRFSTPIPVVEIQELPRGKPAKPVDVSLFRYVQLIK